MCVRLFKTVKAETRQDIFFGLSSGISEWNFLLMIRSYFRYLIQQYSFLNKVNKGEKRYRTKTLAFDTRTQERCDMLTESKVERKEKKCSTNQ